MSDIKQIKDFTAETPSSSGESPRFLPSLGVSRRELCASAVKPKLPTQHGFIRRKIMKSFKNYSLKIMLLLLGLTAAITASAQDARLRFERLNALENRADEVVEVNIDGKLLDLAKRVMVKVNDPNAKKVGQAISGLKGIYVRVYNFKNENEYNVADVDEIRSQLNAPGWEKLANVRSKKNIRKLMSLRCSPAT
jgi:hypothetical protein